MRSNPRIRQRCRAEKQRDQGPDKCSPPRTSRNLSQEQQLTLLMGGISRCLGYLWKRLISIVDDVIDICHWYIWRRWKSPLTHSSTVLENKNAAGASSSLHTPLLSRGIEGRDDAFDTWNERVQARYSHEKDGQLLERLWNAARSIGDNAPQGLSQTTYISDRWVDLGFQSDDPSRDFRGGGVLSLACLVYMAESAPDVFHRLMAKTDGVRSDYEYPFAASCISVVFSLIDALKIRTLSSTHIDVSPSSFGFAHLYIRDEETFEKIVMHAMLYLDEIWLSSSASYMDFPRIQKHVCAHVQRLVGKRWFNDPAMISSSLTT